MGKKLYVGNIPFQATEDDLREKFSTAGEVESVKIITDAYSGQAKGFGFIEMASDEDAKKAIAEINGTSFMDRVIVVNEARPQAPREKRGGFGGGGGRGGGGGNYDRGGYGGGGGRGGKGGRR